MKKLTDFHEIWCERSPLNATQTSLFLVSYST